VTICKSGINGRISPVRPPTTTLWNRRTSALGRFHSPLAPLPR
jgi:hypothetical protein